MSKPTPSVMTPARCSASTTPRRRPRRRGRPSSSPSPTSFPICSSRRRHRGHLGDTPSCPTTGRGRRRVYRKTSASAALLIPNLLKLDRVGAGGNIAQPALDDGLCQHGRGAGAAARDVVGLGGHRLDQLGAWKFSNGSSRSISRATASTLSFVHRRVRQKLRPGTTCRPRGPRRRGLTASASLSTPGFHRSPRGSAA